jgi:excisionase family DNA binding protein
MRTRKIQRLGNGRLLTGDELAARLGESERIVTTLRHKGIIPYLKLGHRTIRYNEAAVMAALEKRQVKAIK